MTDQEPEAGQDRLDISNTHLCGSRFSCVNLSDSDMTDSIAERLSFDDVDLSDLQLLNVNASGARVKDASFAGATFSDVSFEGATFDRVSLRDIAITNADCTGMTIDGVSVGDLFSAWNSQQGDASR